MEEQARLEAAAEGQEEDFNGFGEDDLSGKAPEEGTTASCPICNVNLSGITADDATRHVNGCLDGNPISLPSPAKAESLEVKMLPEGASNRFARKSCQATLKMRPGLLQQQQRTLREESRHTREHVLSIKSCLGSSFVLMPSDMELFKVVMPTF